MKIKSIILAFVSMFVALLVYAPSAKAQEVRSQDNLTVAKTETINSALVANGSTINIEGNIDGDLYCFGSQVVISGRINGDVFCSAQSINISGRVNGSIRLLANDINVSGQSFGSATIFSSNFILTDKAVIGNDLSVVSTKSKINGTIARDLVIYTSELSLNGYVGRNVSGRINQITIGSNADVRGNINYSGQNDPIRMSGSKVSGSIVRTPIMSTASYGSGVVPAILTFLLFMASLLIVSLATVWSFPKFYQKNAEVIKQGLDKRLLDQNKIVHYVVLPLLTLLAGTFIAFIVPDPSAKGFVLLLTLVAFSYILFGKVALFGLANLFLVPMVILVLLVTIIGVPLAGLIAVAWILSLILCGPVFAYYIGSKVISKGKNSKNQTLVMLIGSLIVLSLYAIPVVNMIVGAVVAIVGSGAILAHFKYSNYAPKTAKNKK